MPFENKSVEDASSEIAQDLSLDAPAHAQWDTGISQTPTKTPLLRYNHIAFSVTGLALGVIVLIGVGGLLFSNLRSSKSATQNSAEQATNYSVSNLPLQGLKSSQGLQVGNADHLAVNGKLQVNNTLVLTPTATPSTPTSGQIYYDKTTNAPYYYNGTEFISLAPTLLPQYVSSIGGNSGAISVGNGLQVTDGQLALTNAVLQALAASNGGGVRSLQGQTGDVTLAGGSGINVSGTTIRNTGVISLAAGSSNVIISQDGSGNYTLSDNSVVGSGSVNQIALFTGGQTLGNSILSQSGTTVTAGGNLTVMGAISSNTFQQAAAGNVSISAGTDNLVFTAGGRTFTFPGSGPGSQTICTTGVTCASGGGLAVLLQPGSAQLDTGSGSTIFINNTGSGNLLQLQGAGSDRFVVTNGGNTTISGNLVSQGGTLTSGTGTQQGSLILHAGNTRTATLQAISSLGQNTTYTLPDPGAASATICLSSGNCTGSGAAGGDLTGSYPNPTIAKLQGTTVTIGGLASGQILQYNGSAFVNQLVSGDITLNGAGVATIGAGKVTNANLVNSSLTVTAGSGLSGGGSVSLGGSTSLSVQYGSSAGTAVQGNVTLTCASGTGNLSGGGNSLTLGSGGSCNSISITNSPTFTGTLSVQGIGRVAVGVAGTTAGSLVLANAGNLHFTTLQGMAPAGQDQTITIPASSAATDTVCLLTLANCVGTGGSVSTTGGTQNFVTKYNNIGATQITNSQIYDNGTNVNIGSVLGTGGLFNVGASNQFQIAANGNVIGGTYNTATISGGTVSGGTLSSGTVSGGTLTGTAVNSLNVSGTAISGTGVLTIDANGTNTISLGGISTGNILLGGGSGLTGCTITNNSGNLLCDGTINGATISGGTLSGGTLSGGSVSGGTLNATGVNGLTVSGGSITGGSITSGFGTISTGNTITTTAALQGGTLNIASGNFTVDASGNTVAAGTLAVQGMGGLTIGVPGTTTGNLNLANSTSSRMVVLQGLNPSGTGNATIQIPTVAGGSTDTVCLQTLANCVGSGGAVSTTGGTQNFLTKYNNAGATQISNSQLFDNGTNVGVNTSSGFGTIARLTINANVTADNTAITQINTGAAGNKGLVIQGFGTGVTPNQTADLLQLQDSTGVVLAKFDASGNLTAGTVNGATITSTTFNTAIISGGTLSGGTFSGGTISGGTLTGTAVNSLNVSGTAISGTGALTVNANGTNTISLGGISTGDILFGGGSGGSGCTITNSNGNLLCDGTINGATISGGTLSGGTFSGGSVSGGSLSAAVVNGLTVSGGVITGGSIAAGFGTISTGNTISTSVALQGGTLDIANGNFTVDASGNTVAAGTLAVRGAGGLTIGVPGTTTGNLNLANSTSARQVILQGLNPSGAGNATIQIPTTAGGSTDTVCLLTLANCTGGGVTSSGGTQNFITKYNNAGATQISNSQLFDNGTNVGLNVSSGFGTVTRFTVNTNITTDNAAIAQINTGAAGRKGLVIQGFGTGVTPNQTADLLQFQDSTGVVLAKFDASGNLTAGTLNGATITSTTFNTATISGGTLSGGTFSGGSVSGGTLTGTAVNSLNVSGTAISGTGALTIDANGTNTISLGGSSTGNILFGGGSGGSGCTITNSNGNLLCDGTINGATLSAGTLSGGNFSGGSVSGGTLTGTAVNSLNVSGTAISGTGALTIDANGANTISLGAISTGDILLGGGSGSTGCTLANATGNLTCSGTLAVQGSTVTIGIPGTTTGSLNLANSTSSRQVILQGLNPSGTGDATVRIPTIAGGSTDTVCLLALANCAGAGGGITGSGTSGSFTKFNSTSTITDSSNLSESGAVVTNSGSLVIQAAASLTLGTASANLGSIAFKNATNANTVTLQSGASGSNFSLTLPPTGGSNGDCLQSQGAGVLVFASCTGGAGGGVTSLDGETGVLTLANSSGSGGIITIDDASTSVKGIAQFNATNFTDNGTGTINTIQNINTGASPTFNGLTLSTALTVANGGTGAVTLAANGILYGNGTGAIQATSAAANSILATNGSNIPALTQTLPTAVQGNITSTGALASGSITSGFGTISTANNISTSATVQGNTVTVGTAGTTTGNLNLANSTSSRMVVLQGLNPSGTGNATIQIPTIAGSSTDTVCLLTLANCVGTGGAVSTTGGAQNFITKYNNAGATQISNSQLFDNGTNVGLNTSSGFGTVARLTVNGNVTPDNATISQINTGAAGNKGLVIQGFGTGVTPSQTGDLLQFQDSTGAVLAKFDASGSLTAVAGTFSGAVSVTGSSSFTTGSGTVTLGALGSGLVQSNGSGVLSSGVVDRNSATYFNNILSVANGGTGAASFTTNGILYGNTTGALQVTGAANNSVLVTNGSGVPSLSQTLPTAVQGNITGTGALASGSIASGFGSIATANSITTSSNISTTGTGTITAAGLLTASNGLTVTTGTTSIGSTLNVTGTAAFLKGTDYSTTGTTNDVAFGAGSLIRLTGASAQTITGIAGGTDGRLLTIINAAAQSATLSNANAGSVAANRILTGLGADLSLPADASIKLVYDSGASRWRVVGGAAGGTCSTCANTSLSNLSSVDLNSSLLTSTNNTLDLGASANRLQSGYFGTSVVSPNVTSTAALTLQSGTAGNIVLNSAGTIELQDNTNVTGDLAVSANTDLAGTLFVGTANAFQVAGNGAVTAVGVNSGSGLLQGTGGLTLTGTANINATGTAASSIGNATGTLTLQGNSSSTLVLNGVTLDATELNRLDGKDAALVDTNDTVNTAITGTGALSSGSIAFGFGSIATTNTISTSSNISTTGTGTITAAGLLTASNGLTVTTGTTTIGSTLNVTGTAAFLKGTDYSTTGTSNDAALGAGSLIRLTGASTQTITGIAGGTDGRILTIVNAAGQSAIIANAGTGSTAANRILTGLGVDLTLPSDASITLVYDSGVSRWRVVGGVAGGTCSTCANTSLSNLSSVNLNASLLTTTNNTLDLGASANRLQSGYFGTSVVTPNVTSTAALTLQSGAAGNIILNSAGTIELQDNTNITGDLAVSGNTDLAGTLFVGTANAFQVATSGAVTAVGVNSGSGLLQGTGGLTLTGTASINTTGTAASSIGNATGTLTLQGSSSSTLVLNGVTLDATELNRLDGKDAALVDTNDAVSTAITGTGTLTGGSITSGFGTISTGNTITTTAALQGGTLNIASGNFTVDASGNTVAAGTLAVQGVGGITIGVASTTAGVLKLANATNSNLSALQAAAPSGSGTATYSLPSIAGGTTDTVCLLTLANCAGTTVTLQQAYDADTNSADAVITLTSTDGNLIFRNPSSGGITSGAILKVDQLATGAVEGLRVESAGTSNLLTIRDTTATAVDVFTIADGGAVTLRNQTNSGAAFQIQGASGTSLFKFDTTSSASLLGLNLGASATTATLDLQGSLRARATGATDYTTFLTPGASPATLNTHVVIQGDSTGTADFYHELVVTLNASSGDKARGIIVYDARSVAHQASIGVISPNEAGLGGFTWDGGNTNFKVKTSDSISSDTKGIILQSGDGTASNVNTGAVGIDSGSPSGSGVAGNISIGTGAYAHNTTIGNTTGTSALTLQAGTGNLTLNAQTIANGSATGTTGTTEATARTNVTTVTLTAAGSFANNDIIFLNNAGQDYYTRIVSGGGTTTLTVSPAVSYDVSTTVTKYNIQNIGATASDYTTLNNRFFQGYFLGGVVTGAGSTTLSDSRLASTGAMNFNSPSFIFRNTADSTAAFQIQNAAGASIFNVNTTDSRIQVAANSIITLDGATANAQLKYLSAGNQVQLANYNGGEVQIQGDSFSFANTTDFTSNLTLTNTGAATFKNRANSAAAFQIQSASAADILFTANTVTRTGGVAGNLLKVGNSTGTDTDLTVLQLDAASADPTTNLASLNGGLFYNSNTHKVSIIENGVVKVLCNKTDLTCGAAATTPLQTAYNDDVDGSDATISLTSADDSIVISNPASSGTDSTFTLKVEQLNTGAVEGLRIESAGTGNLLTVRDTTTTAQDVFKIADTGATTLRNQTDSTAAFQVQNAAGTNIFNVDTTNSKIGTANTAAASTASAALTIKSGDATGTGGTSNSGAVVLDSGSSTNGSAGTVSVGTGAYAHNVTVGNSTGATTLSLQGGTGGILLGTTGIANTIQVGNTTGAVAQTISIGTNATASSTNTVQIGSTVGTSSVSIQGGTGTSINIGTAGIANTLQIGNTSGAVAQTINIGTNATASSTNTVLIGSAIGTSVTTIQAGTGGLVAKAITSNATAFTLQDSGGAKYLVADTQNVRLYVGNPTADSTGLVLVLDTKNTSGDPTGVDGAMYYNSNMGRMRCYFDGQWRFCNDPVGLTWGYNMEEEFLLNNLVGGQFGLYNWNASAGGTGSDADTVEQDVNSRPGQILLQTGTTTTGFSSIWTAHRGPATDSLLINAGDEIEFAVNVTTLSDASGGTNEYDLRLGLCDVQSNAECADGVYVEYDRDNSANWRCATVNGGSVTKANGTGATATVATGWHRFKIIATTTASLTFYVDGTAICTNTTNIPTTSTHGTEPSFEIEKEAGTANRTIRVDYFQYRNTLATPR